MMRFVAIAAFLVAIILFVIVAVGNPSNPFNLEAWGFVSVSAGFLALALEPYVAPRA
jgi:YbbR domain-containing protein